MRTTSTIRTINKRRNLGILLIYMFTGQVCVKVIFNFLSRNMAFRLNQNQRIAAI